MNPLTLIVLAVLALFFFQTGSTFLAFLVFVVLIVMLLSSTQPVQAAASAATGTPNPYVIQQQGNPWPAKTKFEFRPNYPGDPDGEEWISGKAGQWFLFFGKAAKSLLGLGRRK